MLLTCLSAPSKKLYDVDKWNACGKSQSLNENEGFYGPGDLGEHLLPGPFRATTFVDDMKHRVNVRTCEGSISSGPSLLPYSGSQGVKKTGFVAEISEKVQNLLTFAGITAK